MNPLIAGFLIYFAMTVAVGFAAVRLNRSQDAYLLADRKLGAWVAAFSERASGESAWLLIGLPGLAFVSGMSAFWVAVGCVSGIAFSWFAIARRLRVETERLGSLTLADYFESRHGDTTRSIRLIAASIILFFFTFYVAAQFLAAGKVLNYYLGVTHLQGMLIGAALVLFYTMAGGLYAVAWTDLVQGVIMLFTLVVLPLAVLGEVGGLPGLQSALGGYDLRYLMPLPGESSWAAISAALGSLGIGLGYMGQPHLVLRFMAITSGDEVGKGRIIAVTWAVLAFVGAVMIGLTGLAHFGPEVLGEGRLIVDQEQLMPMMAREFLPEWLAVIMICGAIAAMMSTADSQLLSSASTVSEDVYRRLLRPDADQGRLLLISRLATLAVGCAAFLLAWRADALVYSLVLYAWAGLGAAFGPPLLLSLWWRRTSRAGVIAGLLTGTAVVLAWYNIPALRSQLYELVPGFALSLAATVVFSLLRPDRSGTGGIDR
ncbi:sodium/proline symporter [bacterium]|nr:sodium/proline symporter [bacterium]MBU1072220.1 sodium/proline symporter [bacterium]MBU1675412.1 sodium/proline symporter [bacterium]